MAGRTMVLRDGHGEYRTRLEDGRVVVNESDSLPVVRGAGGIVRVGDHPRRIAWVAVSGDVRWVFLDGQAYTFDEVKTSARRRTAGHHGTLSAPMPATVIRIQAAAGDEVSRGDVLIVLEAMKMELPVRASFDGVVSAVNCQVGDLVQPGAALIEIRERMKAEG